MGNPVRSSWTRLQMSEKIVSNFVERRFTLVTKICIEVKISKELAKKTKSAWRLSWSFLWILTEGTVSRDGYLYVFKINSVFIFNPNTCQTRRNWVLGFPVQHMQDRWHTLGYINVTLTTYMYRSILPYMSTKAISIWWSIPFRIAPTNLEIFQFTERHSFYLWKILMVLLTLSCPLAA